jgi:signal transduction histidine kinase
VEVKFERLPHLATLEIQDFGHGLPRTVMERFQRTGAGSGVGLAGIHERMKELGGDFKISSSDSGTTLRSTVPLSEETDKEPAPVVNARDVPTSGKQRERFASNVGGIF